MLGARNVALAVFGRAADVDDRSTVRRREIFHLDSRDFLERPTCLRPRCSEPAFRLEATTRSIAINISACRARRIRSAVTARRTMSWSYDSSVPAHFESDVPTGMLSVDGIWPAAKSALDRTSRTGRATRERLLETREVESGRRLEFWRGRRVLAVHALHPREIRRRLGLTREHVARRTPLPLSI